MVVKRGVITYVTFQIVCMNLGAGMLPWGLVLKLSRRFGIRTFADIRSSYIPFEDFVDFRRAQARKSVLIQVNSVLSYSELHSYCSQFGTVVGAHHYTLQNEKQQFMLLEFKTEDEISKLISSSCFTTEPEVIPVRSSCLWFRPPLDKNSNRSTAPKRENSNDENLKLDTINGCMAIDQLEMYKTLLKANSISDQMEQLWSMTLLNDLGIRLRFLAAKQIESMFTNLYPDIAVYPFGSTVNGFGKIGCDLDLVMKLTAENSEENKYSRLVFHTKKSVATGRLQQQHYVEIIGDMIQLFMPGCSQVRRISQARIPIIKYNQDYTGIECDLSISTLSGFYMSELLYLFGSIDSRVKPLVFTIRWWAKEVGLTNQNPGRWISNFSLTLMVIFFLQNIAYNPVLPTLNYLRKHARKNDCRMTNDYVNCTFLRDIKNMSFKSQNKSSLEELLKQFFNFYSVFEFGVNVININDNKQTGKPDYASLYIVNPLENSLNVSKNVNYEECERFLMECRNALWLLQSNETINEFWGIMLLFKNQRKSVVLQSSKRILKVKDLFDEQKESDNQIKNESNNTTNQSNGDSNNNDNTNNGELNVLTKRKVRRR